MDGSIGARFGFSDERRVLVVDDEETIADLIRDVLTRHGCVVDTNAGGRSAIDVAADGRYGLVISDFAIPGLNGLEFVRALRMRNPHAQVLIVSAFLDPETVDLLRAEPSVVGLVRKPFDIFDLVRRVESHFEMRTSPPSSLGMTPFGQPPALRARYAD
ncbi:MAG: response regulator [Planctomycetes bacterium]|nr:response regulator [Planctomycetota bacterium]